jgi:hypothetical protein
MPLDRKIQSGPPACSIEILFPSSKIICHQFKTEEDWEALEEKAKALGMPSGTQLLREIARGFIEKKKFCLLRTKKFWEIFKPVERIAALSPGLSRISRRNT